MTEEREEKELILGNKQLISLFFVVVALCGVCFAMGYIIGHNSMKPAAASDTAIPAPVTARPQESEPPRETEAAPAPKESSAPAADQSASAPAPADPPPAQTSSQEDAQAGTQPAHDASQASGAPDAALTQPVAATSETVPPGAGSYLQVGAVSKGDAENLVRTLREQNLPALMQESPRKGLFRVLVGPYRQTSDLAEAKSRLRTLGFDNAFVQK